MTRVAVVTGGGSGIGLSICGQLAESGYRVAVVDLNGAAARQVARELCARGGQALGCEVDVTDRPAVEEALRHIRARFGPVEILVTSAGLAAFESFTDITLESWDRIMEVNLTGTFHCVQAVIGDMLAARWGRIVTISSSSAQRGSPRMVHYAASKGAVIAMTKSLALEYASFGITVNCIPPSSIDTPMSRGGRATGDVPDAEVMAKAIPVGRLGTGNDIAAACAFLCSDGASFVTGQVLGVNGGAVI
ncbi:MAG: SDR family NAD(P)-dependent oxidoreductase [Frankia sp.]